MVHEDRIQVKLLSTFTIDHVRGDEGKRVEGLGVHLLRLQPSIGIIVTANQVGHVSIFSLPHGEKLAQVGKDALPQQLLIPERKLKPYYREKNKGSAVAPASQSSEDEESEESLCNVRE